MSKKAVSFNCQPNPHDDVPFDMNAALDEALLEAPDMPGADPDLADIPLPEPDCDVLPGGADEVFVSSVSAASSSPESDEAEEADEAADGLQCADDEAEDEDDGAAADDQNFDVMTASLTVPTLLEASAGTGKTFSIKHLVLRLVVEEKMPIERILVVTFTRAATAELAARIQAHIAETSGYVTGMLEADEVDPLVVKQVDKWKADNLDEKDIAALLRAALSGFDNAAIYTIHSFCQKMLTNHAFSASGVFDCDLFDEADDLVRETTEDFLRRELDRAADGEERERLMKGTRWEDKLKVLAATTPDLAPRRFLDEDKSFEEQVLRRFADEAPKKLRELKAEHGVLTFDDLLVDMWRRLRDDKDGKLVDVIRQTYQGVLIDEFQDTDPLQFAVFKRLFLDRPRSPHSGRRALFFVGDPKQAIYRFRSADLNTYMKARALIRRRARLARNFRSSPKLVTAINALFSKVQDPAGPGAFLRPDLAYVPVKYSAGKTGLWRLTDEGWKEVAPMEIWTASKLGWKADERRRTSYEAMANDIAELIQAGLENRAALAAGEDDEVIATVNTEVEGESREFKLRALRAGDIAVLIRKRQTADPIRDALSARGIRIRMKSNADVCKSEEAAEIMLVLRALAAPADERIMRAARATRFMGDSLSAVEQITEEKRTEYRELFEEGRRRWTRLGVAAAFSRLADVCGTARRILPTEGGEQRLTNYEHLIELLHNAGRRYDTPTGLIAWFEKACAKYSQNEERCLRLAGDANLVTVETIHSSKGLQYPIVYLPNSEDLCDTRSRPGSVFRDVDAATQSLCITLSHADRKESESYLKETNEEYVRLAYVAVTRAAARVVISLPAWSRKGDSGPWWADVLKSAYCRALAGNPKPEEADVRRALKTLQSSHPDAVLIRDLSTMPTDPVSVTAVSVDTSSDAFGADEAKNVKTAWRISSFTGLTRMIADDDTGTVQRWFGKPQTVTAKPDILTFPRGTEQGKCLHSILEAADFQAMAQATSEAKKAREELAQSVIEGALSFKNDEKKRMAVSGAAKMVFNVLNTEILPGVYLRDVKPGARTAEMPFLISMGKGANAAKLSELLASIDQKYAVPGLSDESLAGYLTGIIDLAFGAKGKFWILDWKSNAIPDRVKKAADFTQEVMADEMNRHHYRLQYLIYLVALRRFLRARLGKDYRDGLLGGAVYVFLRGVSPTAARAADGIQGVVYDPVPADVIAKLDCFFASEEC